VAQPPIQSLVPGGKPVELVAYYDEFDWYYRTCELETKHWFVKNVRPDWEIFDVGANVGVYSVLFSRLASLGHVVAFEPTITADMLRANLAHNGCQNVRVEQIAIGSKTGSVEDHIYRIWGNEPERQVYPFYLDDYVRNNNIIRRNHDPDRLPARLAGVRVVRSAMVAGGAGFGPPTRP
jgi:FkbM family methyltransferase